jgi:hypothetical protein
MVHKGDEKEEKPEDNYGQFGSIWFISLLYAGHSLYFVGIFILRFWFASLKGPGDDRAVGMRC